MGNLDFLGIQAPRDLDGAGMDSVGYAVVIEEISRVCASSGLCVTVHMGTSCKSPVTGWWDFFNS